MGEPAVRVASMAASDDVHLPDLEVIQRFSLAVRGATAPREAVVAALRADLARLAGEPGDAAADAIRSAARTPSRGAAARSGEGPPPVQPARRVTAAADPSPPASTEGDAAPADEPTARAARRRKA
jgi:hypothetical protein